MCRVGVHRNMPPGMENTTEKPMETEMKASTSSLKYWFPLYLWERLKKGVMLNVSVHLALRGIWLLASLAISCRPWVYSRERSTEPVTYC